MMIASPFDFAPEPTNFKTQAEANRAATPHHVRKKARKKNKIARKSRKKNRK